VPVIIAGNEVDAWCTKCRMDLIHRVVAAVAGKPKRVECQTCHTQHNYRPPKGAKDPIPKDGEVPTKEKKAKAAKAAKSTKVPRKLQPLVNEWEARVLGQAAAAFAAYSAKAQFAANQLLRHKSFGEGFVAEVMEDKKINVVFREGKKTLVHGRS
jgi:hypothetical protein